MDSSRIVRRFILIQLALLASVATAPAHATTLLYKGLDQLTIDNETIVQARVLDIHSYWNVDHTFILTDVHARPSQVLKGATRGDVEFTLMGGSVGDVTVLVIGGADLVPGAEYVLFLNPSPLPGSSPRLTIPDHSQGAFQVEAGRVVSQAVEEPLLPDALGRTEAPGGKEGVALDEFLREVRAFASRTVGSGR